MQSSWVPEGLWKKKMLRREQCLLHSGAVFRCGVFFEDVFLGAAGICI